ncbi:MAG TPA: diacylglycerol kinase family protein [Nitrococcus sp.]|nr:diacylglycerol kinase family protein [Nitrococcus sp.]
MRRGLSVLPGRSRQAGEQLERLPEEHLVQPLSELAIPVPRRIGVLCNPNSGRNRRHLRQVREEAKRLPGAIYREAVYPAETAGSLRDLLASDVELLVINGGDGTLQAALTWLLGPEGPDEGKMPPLAVIAGGTTNMTAADIGARAAPRQALRAVGAWLARAGGGPSCTERPVLQLEPAPDRPPLYGMFFGAGAIHTGVEFFHRRIAALGTGGTIGPGLACARLLFSLAWPAQTRVQPVRLTLRLDDDTAQAGDYLLILVSALERLLLGSKPYWGREPASLHYTAIRHRPGRLLRSLPAVLRGGTRPPREQDGYVSHNIHTLMLDFDGGFVLDGECFQAERKQGPLRLSLGARMTFLSF